jgi:hypothetical protein
MQEVDLGASLDLTPEARKNRSSPVLALAFSHPPSPRPCHFTYKIHSSLLLPSKPRLTGSCKTMALHGKGNFKLLFRDNNVAFASTRFGPVADTVAMGQGEVVHHSQSCVMYKSNKVSALI